MSDIVDGTAKEAVVESASKNVTRESSNEKPGETEIASEAVSRITRTSATLMVLVGGLALFSDGYNAQIIGYMNPLFADLYPDAFTKNIKTRLSNAYLIGEVFGMIFFGWAIDKLGRRTGIVFATLFLVLGVILATASHGKDNLGMFWMMIVMRGVAGFGAGGEYPTCATSSTEASDESAFVRRRRGLLVGASTDLAIDFGFVIAGIVAIIVLSAYNQKVSEGIWRICFGLGFILPIGLLFFRLRLINSTQYRKHAMRHNIPYGLVLKRYWKPMLGTSLAWFMYDFVTYPFGLFSDTIVGDLNPKNTLLQNIGYGTVINSFYLPGCLLGAFLMDRIGRKQTMTLGFVIWCVMGFVLGGALRPIQSVLPLFIVLYGIFQAAGEMGPGVATFLCAAESFPTPLRGHFLGLAAAVGKAGAAIGTEVFTPIQDSFDSAEKGVQAVFYIGASFSLIGALITWFLIPDREKDLESEDARFRAYLEENGYKGTFGDSLEREIQSTSFKA